MLQFAEGRVLLALAVSLLIAGGAFLSNRAMPVIPPSENLVIVTQSGKEYVFDVEIADTPAEHEMGLMYRRMMAADHGMLFKMGFPPKEIQFWMKNTVLPLDILFVDEAGQIRTIKRGSPGSLVPIGSEAPVVAAIELNAGVPGNLGIHPGDRVKHAYFK